MALDLATMKSRFASLVTSAPVSVTFGSTTFSALRTQINSDRRRDTYGGADTYQFSLLVAESALTSWPANGDTVTIGGVTYRAMETVRDPLGISRTIDLEAQYQ